LQVRKRQLSLRLPVVLTYEEVRRILEHLHGVNWLAVMLLYGSGLRLLECLRLRIKDVDFSYRHILVREDKGKKDRVTLQPMAVETELQEHILAVKRRLRRDLEVGAGHVKLPGALARKYPNASREWAWQWVLPASRLTEEHGSPVRVQFRGPVPVQQAPNACPAGGLPPRCAFQQPLRAVLSSPKELV
jgi:integrase